MRYGTLPSVSEIEGESEGETLTPSLYEAIKRDAQDEGYYLTSVLIRRAALPKFDKPVLFQQRGDADFNKRDIDVPLKLMADDDPELRGLDCVFEMERI